MEIVPENDQLIFEGKIDPRDIDQVGIGADAGVKIMAVEERAYPNLTGKVILVSADLTRERAAARRPPSAPTIPCASLPKKEVERLGDLKLLPGMQAEVFIQTYPRTPLAY